MKLLRFIYHHIAVKRKGNFELAAGFGLFGYLFGKLTVGTSFAVTHSLLAGPSITLISIGALLLSGIGIYKKVKR